MPGLNIDSDVIERSRTNGEIPLLGKRLPPLHRKADPTPLRRIAAIEKTNDRVERYCLLLGQDISQREVAVLISEEVKMIGQACRKRDRKLKRSGSKNNARKRNCNQEKRQEKG